MILVLSFVCLVRLVGTQFVSVDVTKLPLDSRDALGLPISAAVELLGYCQQF